MCGFPFLTWRYAFSVGCFRSRGLAEGVYCCCAVQSFILLIDASLSELSDWNVFQRNKHSKQKQFRTQSAVEVLCFRSTLTPDCEKLHVYSCCIPVMIPREGHNKNDNTVDDLINLWLQHPRQIVTGRRPANLKWFWLCQSEQTQPLSFASLKSVSPLHPVVKHAFGTKMYFLF